MKGQNFRQLYESMGPQGTYQKIVECLATGDLKPDDFELKELYIGCCGERSYVERGRRFAQMQHTLQAPRLIPEDEYRGNDRWLDNPGQILREAGEAVDVSAFSAITGQLYVTAVNKGWENAEAVSDRIFTNFPTQLSGEKIPWLSNIFGATPGDSDIHPGMNYPELTFGPRWITSPRTKKKGGILSLSMEFMLFDRTGQAGSMGGEKVGEAIRYDKEYLCLRMFLGLDQSYNLNGTAYNTYLTTGTNYVNAQSATPLVDYTSVNNAIYLFSKILDPDTGRPIRIGMPPDMFVMPFAVMNAKRILTATGTQTVYPGYSAATPPAPGNVKFDSGNPINWGINLMTSPIAYQLLINSGLTATQANAYWWSGDFKKTFYYAENFPFQSFQAAPQNLKDFEQDIQLRFKVREMGAPFVWDPRYTCEFFNT